MFGRRAVNWSIANLDSKDEEMLLAALIGQLHYLIKSLPISLNEKAGDRV